MLDPEVLGDRHVSNEERKEGAVASYAKGYWGGLGGILASDDPIIASLGAMSASDDKRKRDAGEDAASQAGEGLGYLLALAAIAPPFIAPGYALYQTWLTLRADQWHPLLVILIAGAEVAALVGVLWLLYRFVPRVVGSLLAALYMGLCYGLTLRYLGADQVWVIGVGALTALAGYMAGHRFHHMIAASNVTFASAGRRLANGCAELSLGIAVSAYFGTWGLTVYWVLPQLHSFFGDQLYSLLGDKDWTFIVNLALCAVVGAAMGVLPALLGILLLGFTPRWLATPLLMAALGVAARIVTNWAGLDAVWTSAAILTAAIGGWRIVALWAQRRAETA